MSPAEQLPRLAYSVAEWSQMTGLSRPTIYRMMAAGELRYSQIRGIRRIPATEAERLGFKRPEATAAA